MSTKTGIEFDQSDREVLLVCHDCGGTWRAFAWDISDAEHRAAAHEARTHPGVNTITERIRARHAMRDIRANTP